MKKVKGISTTNIDSMLFDIEIKMHSKYTILESEKYISPLVHYVNTGRAPIEFLRYFVNLNERQKGAVINRLVKYYGDDKAAIDSVAEYVMWRNL